MTKMNYRGWLLVNSYMNGAKFQNIYRALEDAAAKMDLSLQFRGNGDVPAALFGRPPEELPDFVLFWDKDVPLARALEARGVPLFNCADAIEACDDKIRTALCLAAAGIPMPETVFGPKTFDENGLTDFAFLDRAGQILSYPMVIKEAFGSFGMQVHLAHDRPEAERIIRGFANRPFLMQRFVSECAGEDVRINVVGGRVIACMARRSVNGDFRSNASLGGEIRAADPPEEAKRLAIRAAEALKLAFGGVDVLLPPGKEPLICEVNSNPHFLSTREATGVDLAPHILRHILSELEKNA